MVKANKNSPWARLLVYPEQIFVEREGSSDFVARSTLATTASEESDSNDEEFNTASFEKLISGENSALSEIVLGVRRADIF